tara:strand:- start:447 stop:1247 length:801 start_codon:yes stop_codon:yes gene_type:complete
VSQARNAIQRTVAQRAAAGTPNNLRGIADLFGLGGIGGGGNRKAGNLGGGPGGGGVPRGPLGTPSNPPFGSNLKGIMAQNPKFFPALTVLGLGAGVAGEFADDDPIARNALQSIGVVGGGLAGQQLGTVLGGILGAPLGPVGALTGAGIGRFVGGGLGTYVGTNLGSDVMGGLYDAVTGSSQRDRDLEAAAKRIRYQTQLEKERLQTLAPVMNTMDRMRDARAIEMAKQNAQIASDYNFANSLNTSRLNLQQSEADAIAIAMQNLL